MPIELEPVSPEEGADAVPVAPVVPAAPAAVSPSPPATAATAPGAVELEPVAEPESAVQLEAVDPLDDFEAYNALEDEREARGYDPEDPGLPTKLLEGVKGVLSQVPAAVRGAATLVRGNPAFGAGGDPAAIALLTQTGGEALASYKTLGEGAKPVAMKAVAKLAELVPDPRVQAAAKRASRQASWEFLREARDTDAFTADFNRHLETIFPQALAGLGAIPVDRAQAQGLTLVADPANLVPAGAAARWTTQAPMRGAVRAAEAAVREASFDFAKASVQREALQAAAAPAWKVAGADATLEAAKTRRIQALKALEQTTAAQRAVVDQLATEAAARPLVTRAAAAGTEFAGRATAAAGDVLQRAAALPERLAGFVARGADDSARNSIAEGVRNLAGGFGLVPAAAGGSGVLLSRAGRNLQAYGRVLAEAEGQLPFFQRVARETTGLSSWTASLVDQSGLGAVIVPVARTAAEATRGLPFAAAVGYVGSGGDLGEAARSAGGGLVFGMAGGAYGQWRRYASGAAFRQRQTADIQRYRTTIVGDEARQYFDKLPGADRAAIATMQLAHPDLRISYGHFGKGLPSKYYQAADGPVALVNLDTQDGVKAVLAHEVGHHVERHGLGSTIERVLFGDPLLEQPGLFTELDRSGQPIMGEDGRYELNRDWYSAAEEYHKRLKATSARTGEIYRPRDDAQIGREIFAEHVADYLLEDGALSKDLRSNVWSRALASIGGSELVTSTPALRQMLGKMGVPLDSGRRVVGSELFPGGLPASKQLRKLIRDYHRRAGRVPALDEERGGVRYTAKELQEHPQILEQLFNGSDDVARDRNGKVKRDKEGRPVFQSPKEQKALRAALAKEIITWLEQNPPVQPDRAPTPSPGADGADAAPAAAAGEAPPAAAVDETPAKPAGRPTGAREEVGGPDGDGWVTPWLPDELIRKLEASGKYNPAQLAHLRIVSGLVREGRGSSTLFFYQPATKAGKRYESLQGDWRTETPYQIFISKAGNVLFRTMSKEKLMANVDELVGKGRAGLWNNNRAEVVRDVETYLANHAAGRPGAEGIGTEKRDQINALFGINTKKNAEANPFKETAPKSGRTITSRRLDRTNRMTVIDEQFPTSYDRLNQNLRPEPVPADAGGGLGPEAEVTSWDQVKPGMDFDRLKRLIPKSADQAPRFHAKGTPEEVYTRIRNWLDNYPVVQDADGRRILLANPEGGGADRLMNRAIHLASSRKGGQRGYAEREFDLDKARLVSAIPKTLEDYHAKLERVGVELYFRRYADGLLHLVVVNPGGMVSAHGRVEGGLISQYSPIATLRFPDSRLVKVRGGSSTPPSSAGNATPAGQ